GARRRPGLERRERHVYEQLTGVTEICLRAGNLSVTLISALDRQGQRPGVASNEFQSLRDEIQMSVAALFTWMITIFGGLILLVIWMIEYDSEFQSAAATRL